MFQSWSILCVFWTWHGNFWLQMINFELIVEIQWYEYEVVRSYILLCDDDKLREAFQKKTRGKSENGIKGGGVSDLIHFFKFFQKNEKTLRRGGGKPSISFLLTSYWLLRKELFQLIDGKNIHYSSFKDILWGYYFLIVTYRGFSDKGIHKRHHQSPIFYARFSFFL